MLYNGFYMLCYAYVYCIIYYINKHATTKSTAMMQTIILLDIIYTMQQTKDKTILY